MWGLSNEPLLTDRGPGEPEHNLSAGALRRGLAVNAFALLEAYLQARLEELLSVLAGARWNYSNFPEDLRKLLTLKAAIGLASKLTHAVDKLAFAESGLLAISGYAATPPVYTSFGFSSRGSNVYAEDIAGCIRAFGIEKPWRVMAEVASKIGSTRVDISQDFSNSAGTRHSCAHDARAMLPTADLKTHLECVALIGIAFDVIATSAVTAISSSRKASDIMNAQSRSIRTYRFADHQIGGSIAERIDPNGRVVKLYSNEMAARAGLLSRKAGSEFRIIRNAQKVPVELF
jgi:hypothetical protein